MDAPDTGAGSKCAQEAVAGSQDAVKVLLSQQCFVAINTFPVVKRRLFDCKQRNRPIVIV